MITGWVFSAFRLCTQKKAHYLKGENCQWDMTKGTKRRNVRSKANDSTTQGQAFVLHNQRTVKSVSHQDCAWVKKRAARCAVPWGIIHVSGTGAWLLGLVVHWPWFRDTMAVAKALSRTWQSGLCTSAPGQLQSTKLSNVRWNGSVQTAGGNRENKPFLAVSLCPVFSTRLHAPAEQFVYVSVSVLW